jgi:hypothetical protein
MTMDQLTTILALVILNTLHQVEANPALRVHPQAKNKQTAVRLFLWSEDEGDYFFNESQSLCTNLTVRPRTNLKKLQNL